MLGLAPREARSLARFWSDVAFAQSEGFVTIGWPRRSALLGPDQRFTPDAQSIFKLVFDQPLDQNEKSSISSRSSSPNGS